MLVTRAHVTSDPLSYRPPQQYTELASIRTNKPKLLPKNYGVATNKRKREREREWISLASNIGKKDMQASKDNTENKAKGQNPSSLVTYKATKSSNHGS